MLPDKETVHEETNELSLSYQGNSGNGPRAKKDVGRPIKHGYWWKYPETADQWPMANLNGP